MSAPPPPHRWREDVYAERTKLTTHEKKTIRAKQRQSFADSEKRNDKTVSPSWPTEILIPFTASYRRHTAGEKKRVHSIDRVIICACMGELRVYHGGMAGVSTGCRYTAGIAGWRNHTPAIFKRTHGRQGWLLLLTLYSQGRRLHTVGRKKCGKHHPPREDVE